jgi:hypothetical protein
MMVIMLSGFGLLVVCLAYFLIRGSQPPVSSLADLGKNTRPTDLEAFLNLVDPGEDEFLRSALTRGEFLKVRRLRVAAAAEYLNCVRHNAAVLLAIGDIAQQLNDEEAAHLGRDIATAAIRLRIASSAALIKLAITYAVPRAGLSIFNVIDGYRSISQTLGSFCRTQGYIDEQKILAAL